MKRMGIFAAAALLAQMSDGYGAARGYPVARKRIPLIRRDRDCEFFESEKPMSKRAKRRARGRAKS